MTFDAHGTNEIGTGELVSVEGDAFLKIGSESRGDMHQARDQDGRGKNNAQENNA
jgi:hypothetical protein